MIAINIGGKSTQKPFTILLHFLDENLITGLLFVSRNELNNVIKVLCKTKEFTS